MVTYVQKITGSITSRQIASIHFRRTEGMKTKALWLLLGITKKIGTQQRYLLWMERKKITTSIAYFRSQIRKLWERSISHNFSQGLVTTVNRTAVDVKDINKMLNQPAHIPVPVFGRSAQTKEVNCRVRAHDHWYPSNNTRTRHSTTVDFDRKREVDMQVCALRWLM